MGNLPPLHRGRREPGILKNAEKTHDGCNHGDQPKFFRRKQSGEHHDICQIQQELGTLRRHSDKAAGDRPLPQIRQQMTSFKMLFDGGCRRRQ